ncbi:MAG TPA: aldehyde dehydrogenase (NADP(+)) [Vicinamibacterales bacterium]|nr:aldehyde dehydrogenase (NADP(+)) [Acidobacteriota bacterium]HOC16813.1 aldehyde dehydrogenase (NADP(+)) [Vicinamibacterales bacterium]
MTLHGCQIIAGRAVAAGPDTFLGRNPATGEATTPPVHEATSVEVDQALEAADAAFDDYRRLGAERIASFLEAVASEWMALGDDLLAQAHAETALPAARLTGERARMVNQARLFAALAREGSWVDARIDHGDPSRQPVPKPDVRRMLEPIGPVAVFGASNFPFAISVGGGDTVSALAAGCPVVAKAHPGHPGTSELLGRAIVSAAEKSGVPAGVFGMVQGRGHEVGLALVRHPLTRVVAFTGSQAGGRALFDAAAARPDPIPVCAEMGSTNPVFVLPGAMAERGAEIAEGYVQSVTLGTGQFCTNPGVLLAVEGPALVAFLDRVAAAAAAVAPSTMLNEGICRAFHGGLDRVRQTHGVRVLRESHARADRARAEAGCAIFTASLSTLEARPELWDEVFGPSSIVIVCPGADDLERAARRLHGHLTASIHATAAELESNRQLVAALERHVGRIVFNGFPTGIEVCAAMHHGGPWPATTDVRYTSIGTASIERFVRPVCYQGFPQPALPAELQDVNTRGIWRLVDGVRCR